MSLSLDLLDGKIDKVRRRLRLGAYVNDFDPYGYTPLIIAIMTQQEQAIELLLEYGADVNRVDLFGQPPLHWAIKSQSASICELLLKNNAFPNTVSVYGEPLLVYPLLKKDKELIDILTHHGTDRSCAEDYIMAKSLGHLFELKGFGLFKNYNLLISLVDYQGFRLEFSIGQLVRQLEFTLAAHAFSGSDGAYISEILVRAHKMRMLKKALPSDQESEFVKYLGEINFIPLAFDGHAVSLAHSQNFVICCDRSQGQVETTVVYKMPNPLSIDQISFLLYSKKNRSFWNSLPSQLSWKKICAIDIPFQTVGNCSWANLEPMPILIQALIDLEKDLPPQPERWKEQASTWAEYSKNIFLQQALVKISQLKGDRRLALFLTLFDIFIQSPTALKQFDVLEELLNSETEMLQSISYQHQIANTPWWPKIKKCAKDKGWKIL
jgi:hypothetical protein